MTEEQIRDGYERLDSSLHAPQDALDRLWRYTPELFEADAVDEAAAASGLGPRWADLREDWHAAMQALLDEAGVRAPATGSHVTTGRRGVHSEHMGRLLAEMQHLQRAYPGGAW